MEKVLASALLGMAMLAGCATGGASSRPSAEVLTAGATDWSTASYRYTITSSCGERAFLGTYHVTVEEGRIRRITTDDPDEQITDWSDGELPTIADLVHRAQADGDDAPSELVLDPRTGIPTRMSFEGDPNAIDDEECYEISDYQPGVGPGE